MSCTSRPMARFEQSRLELLELLAVEAVGAVRLGADPEDALAVFVDREDPVVFAVLLDVIRSDALAVVAPDDAAEDDHPHGAVVADHARHEEVVSVLLVPAEIADSLFLPVPL